MSKAMLTHSFSNKIKAAIQLVFFFVAYCLLPAAPVHAFVWPSGIPFGFQIREKVQCECSLNHRYKPWHFGWPAPLIPNPLNKDERPSAKNPFPGGSLVTISFGADKIPGWPFPQDEFDHEGLNKNEWVLGTAFYVIPPTAVTPGVPLAFPCLNLVVTWTGPTCKTEFGWLWRIIGSSKGGVPPLLKF